MSFFKDIYYRANQPEDFFFINELAEGYVEIIEYPTLEHSSARVFNFGDDDYKIWFENRIGTNSWICYDGLAYTFSRKGMNCTVYTDISIDMGTSVLNKSNQLSPAENIRYHEITFMTLNGRIIKTIRNERLSNIHTTDLPKGIYILRLEINGDITKQKLLLK